jgi:quercetin dioxygenase-like cupin family protein
MEDLPLGVVARYPLTDRLEGYEVVLSRSAMRFFPGASTPVHSHPGIVLGYVLEGRMRFAIDGQSEQIVPAGRTFFEPLGAVHTTSGSASAGEATTILVFELRPRELPPAWETLVREPLPADIEPVIGVNALTMPGQPVAEHSHPGPVIGYIVDGEIENQIDPDPPAIFKAGGVFYEPPGHLHKMMRSVSAAPARLLIFHAGRTGVPEALVRPLPDVSVGGTTLSFGAVTQWQAPISATPAQDQDQELRLVRLTLPTGSRSEARTHSGPGLIYVIEGVVTISGPAIEPQTFWAGDLFRDPNNAALTFNNASSTAPLKLLFYHVTKKGG